MLFLNCTQKSTNLKKANLLRMESDSMLDEEICRLRDELNKCISDGEDYSKIYKVSVELDKLIAEYYRTNN